MSDNHYNGALIERGAYMILNERHRQIDTEGYDFRHDDEHENGEILKAAIAYAMNRPHWWPWENEWKREARPMEAPTIRDLTKAGALIAAEIDRKRRAGER